MGSLVSRRSLTRTMNSSRRYQVWAAGRHSSASVSAASLSGLLSKGRRKLGLDGHDEEEPYVVLAEDGTIVDDEDYFLCQPEGTSFMILRSNEEWTDGNLVTPKLESPLGAQRDNDEDGLHSEDQVDSAEHSSNWRPLARQLHEDLAQIITMSESELQALIDAPTAELAKEMRETMKGAEELQDTLQHTLDNREEQRQAKDLLQLYLQASASEKVVVAKVKSPLGAQKDDATNSEDQVDSAEHTSNWRPLARQFKEHLARIITMSESELRALIKAPPAELAKELNETLKGAERLRRAIQQSLDKREEQRQAKVVLEQYLKTSAPEKDDSEDAKATDQVDCSKATSSQKSFLRPHTIRVLEKKGSPEVSLSNEELQEVINVDEAVLAAEAQCSLQKVKKMKCECQKELEKRSQQVNALEELSFHSKKKRLTGTCEP